MRTLSAMVFIAVTAAGQGWVRQESGTGNRLEALWFTDSLHGWAVGQAGTSIVTTDGGNTWTSFNLTGADLEDISFRDESVGAIVGDSGLAFSTNDGGQDWSTVPTGVETKLHAVAHGISARAYAAGDDGVILRSTLAGGNWYLVETGSVRWEGLFGIDGTRAWVVGGEGNIKVTDNGGASWSGQTSGTTSDLKSVYFTSRDEGWAVGQNDVALHTSDGGTTWSPRNAGISSGLEGVHFVSPDQGWVVGSAGAVYRTSDGGLNWAAEQSGVNVELNDVFFLDATRGWAVGDSGTIIRRLGEGIEEEPGRVRVREAVPRVVKGVLTLAGSQPGVLLDAAGRQIRALGPGLNHLGAVPAGVYFVCIGGAGRSGVHKLLVVE